MAKELILVPKAKYESMLKELQEVNANKQVDDTKSHFITSEQNSPAKEPVVEKTCAEHQQNESNENTGSPPSPTAQKKFYVKRSLTESLSQKGAGKQRPKWIPYKI